MPPPIASGCSLGHKPCLLNVNGWDTDHMKNSKSSSGKFGLNYYLIPWKQDETSWWTAGTDLTTPVRLHPPIAVQGHDVIGAKWRDIFTSLPDSGDKLCCIIHLYSLWFEMRNGQLTTMSVFPSLQPNLDIVVLYTASPDFLICSNHN